MSEQATWKRLGSVAPTALTEARVQLHWAARVVAAADALAAADAEDRGRLEWVEADGALVGCALDQAEGRRVGVRVADLCLLVLDSSGEVDTQLALDNLSAENAATWLKFTLGADTDLALSNDGLAEHELGTGATFEALDPEVFEELARWYGNAGALLEAVRADNQPASPVRCPVAGLEIATWIDVDAAAGKQIAVGMMSGGADFAEPHWFVRPSPRPSAPPEAELPGGGAWHADGWLAAVLSGADIVAAGGAPEQRARVEELVAAALAQCRDLLA